MALALDLRGIDPTALAAWLDLPPVVEGRADLYLEATAAGDNPRDLIGSLIGELRIALRDGRLVGGEPLAELRALEAMDGAGRRAAPRVTSLAGTPAAARPPARRAGHGDRGSQRELRARARHRDGRGGAARARGRAGPARGHIDLLLWVADLTLTADAVDGTTNGAAGLHAGRSARPAAGPPADAGAARAAARPLSRRSAHPAPGRPLA